MPKTTVIQTNFTAGQISPRLLGRVDIDKYRNAAEGMVNCHPLVHGGCVRRPGKRFIASTKIAGRLARLIPFVYSKTVAYQIELGHLYMRVYATNPAAQILSAPVTPLELVTPYLDSELDDIHYVQGGVTGALFLSHIAHPIMSVTTLSPTSWKCVVTPWEFEPADEIQNQPLTVLTLSALSGVGVTATLAAAGFTNSDVGRNIIAGNGSAVITGFTSTTVVTVTVIDAFATLVNAGGQWGLDQSPKTTVAVSAVGPIGAAVTCTAGVATWQNTAQFSHVGRFVNANGGLVEITSLASNLVANGIVRSILSSTLTVGADGWTLDSKVWGGTRGYPASVGLYQQRLLAGGSPGYPQTIWGTKTGQYLNFAQGASDSDGFVFTINSDQINPIEHLTNSKALAAFTYGGEITLRGGAEKALSATNVQAETQSAYGCNNVRPLRIGNEILFWTRSGRKLRAFSYQIANDGYTSPDMTVLAENISSPGIVQMAYAQEPDSTIHALRADGVMAVCAFDREQNVIGWATDVTNGIIESVSANPAPEADQTWNVVARVVNGAIVRSVEVDDNDLGTDFAITGSNYTTVTGVAAWAAGVVVINIPAHGLVNGETIRQRNFIPDGYNGDFVVTVVDADHYSIPIAVNPGVVLNLGDAAFASVTWTGLLYALGQVIRPVADDVPMVPQVITGNSITLERGAYEVEFGIEFENHVDILPVEQPGQFGTAQGNAISVNRYVVRCYNTVGMTINGTQIPTRAFGSEVLDSPVRLFTGDIDLSRVGWDKNLGGRVTIGQSLPLPWQILACIREVTVNNG